MAASHTTYIFAYTIIYMYTYKNISYVYIYSALDMQTCIHTKQKTRGSGKDLFEFPHALCTIWFEIIPAWEPNRRQSKTKKHIGMSTRKEGLDSIGKPRKVESREYRVESREYRI